ncbi:MAG: DMT family transporter [Alphaproteobacteria bacterium]|nr:DMT family transporter [Alphaproteobacteria bacterium]
MSMLVLVALGWGFTWPVVRYLLSEFAPITMRALMCLVAIAGLGLTAIAHGDSLRIARRHWGSLAAASFLNMTVWILGTTYGVALLSASEAVILAYTTPVWVAIIAWPVLGERPTGRRLLALALGLAGVFLVMAGRDGAGPATTATGAEADFMLRLIGGAATITGSIGFALGTVLTKRARWNIGVVSATFWQTLIGTVPVAILAPIIEHQPLGPVSLTAWLVLAAQGLIGLCGCYLLWFRALTILPAGVQSIGSLMVPVFGVLISAVWLAEPITLAKLAALGLTLAGVALAARS